MSAPRTAARIVALSALVIASLFLLFTVIFIAKFPFSRANVTKLIHSQTSGSVQFASFRNIYFPRPGFIAQGVVIRLPGVQGPPLISIRQATVAATYAGLLGTPQAIELIRADGLELHIPKSAPGSKFQSGLDNKMILEHVIADNAVLDIDGAHFDLHHVALTHVTGNRPLSFEASLSIPEPPGDVTAQGLFGPWSAQHTRVSGKYHFRHADLGVFQGLGGLLSSDGSFSGELSSINVSGAIDIPDFDANNTPHRLPLEASFRARVDATNGDVFLDSVGARFRDSLVSTNGSVKSDQGAVLSMDIPSGRIDDFLYMLLDANRPGMFGAFTAKLNIRLPPGDAPFVRKLELSGDFGIAAAAFGSAKTQQGVDKLSQRARGEKETEDPSRVLSNLRGHVDVHGGVARLSNISFTVPGAMVRLTGTYDLPREYVHLTGTLRMDANISQATHGVLSFLLKPFTGLFHGKHHSAGTVLPIRIAGPYGDTQVHITPVPSKLARR